MERGAQVAHIVAAPQGKSKHPAGACYAGAISDAPRRASSYELPFYRDKSSIFGRPVSDLIDELVSVLGECLFASAYILRATQRERSFLRAAQ